jgi:class 3 adenylate cyclase
VVPARERSPTAEDKGHPSARRSGSGALTKPGGVVRSATKIARYLAKTVAEVRSQMEADSAALTSLFAGHQDMSAGHWRWPATPSAVTGPFLTCRECGCATTVIAEPAEACDAKSSSFWASLTAVERSWLLASTRIESFPAGALICRQDEMAERIWILMSGQVVVYVAQPGDQRCVALREAGDIIGERAAIEVQPRSATVVTLVPVRALVFAAATFAAFLQRYPRALTVLEGQIRDRVVGDPPAPCTEALVGIASTRPPWHGLNCTIFMADIAAFGGHSRNDKDRQFLRTSMYAILRQAFEGSGVSWRDCYHEDRGDGVLIIVPPSTPTSQLIDPLSDCIAAALAAHNDQVTAQLRMQLRVALHVGPVVSDDEGVCGESIIIAARILDAPMLKRQMVQEVADLGLIVSAYVYDTVVKHAPGRVNPALYRRVRVSIKEARLDAWTCTLGTRNPTLGSPLGREQAPRSVMRNKDTRGKVLFAGGGVAPGAGASCGAGG